MRRLLLLLLVAALAHAETDYPNSDRIKFKGGVSVGPQTFANLPSLNVSNGSILYCTNCTGANPCAGSGTGAVARRENGAWNCGGGAGGGGPLFPIGGGAMLR